MTPLCYFPVCILAANPAIPPSLSLLMWLSFKSSSLWGLLHKPWARSLCLSFPPNLPKIILKELKRRIRTCTDLTEDVVWFLAPKLGSSQPPITPAVGGSDDLS